MVNILIFIGLFFVLYTIIVCLHKWIDNIDYDDGDNYPVMICNSPPRKKYRKNKKSKNK